MCYRLVDMIATDKTLQDEEFYSEYLKWKDTVIPTSGKRRNRSCSPQNENKIKRRQLFKPKSMKSDNTDNLSFFIKDRQEERIDEVISNKKELPSELSWSNITLGKKIQELDDARISKAGLRDGDNNIATCVKIYDKMPSTNIMQLQANALISLKGIRGIPHLYGIVTNEEPTALIMSFNPGRTLRKYIDGGDTLMSLMAFSDLCKIFEKIHSRCWAHYDIKASNIHLNIDDQGKVRAHIIDFTFSNPVQSNPYRNVESLPDHLPEDVLNQQCEGDLVDRYSLCYIANEICCKMVDAAETKTLRRAVHRGLIARSLPHARKRPGPLALSRIVNALVGNYTHLAWKYDQDK